MTGRVTPQARPRACLERTLYGFITFSKKKTTLIGEARSKFCNHYTDQRQSLLDSQETPEKVMLLFLPFKSTLVLQEHHPG